MDNRVGLEEEKRRLCVSALASSKKVGLTLEELNGKTLIFFRIFQNKFF